ncbi:MAG TPA: choice-of-anchor A family protein [Chitinophagaceae bacterium]|nr:choice-of-anchor A family protein [Chitinophagaceae bacterium]HNL59819.1 choice-of-anchor A family protein [Chitinophagaceae bacterium]
MRKIFTLLCFLSVSVINLYSQMSGCVAGAAPGCPIPYPYPPQTYPSIQGRDNGFNVFVGGNLVIMSGGAELEGRTYVNGNFDVQKSSGAFNVGYVGAGSYVIPDNGADALIVGGNILTAGAKVYFGGYLGAVDLPMNLKYKGSSSVTPPGFFQAGDIPGGTEGQLINEPSLDLSSHQNLLTTWGNTSTTYGGLSASANGTFTNNSGAYTFASTNGASGVYVFNINTDLNPGYSTTITFDNFPDNAEIIINMTKAGTVTTNLASFTFSNISGNSDKLMERLIWNFPNATTVNINGSSQNRGAILSKATNTNINTSTNGRILTTGNLVFGNTGSGLELHNYPLRASSLTTLPVKLVSFYASSVNNKVNIIKWIAPLEIGSSHYLLERSDNGINFSTVVRINARGNNSNRNFYEYLDINPLSGRSFYRLKIVDLDGSYDYSNIVSCDTKKSFGLSVFPNPAKSDFYVVSDKIPQNEVIVQLIDLIGSVSFSKSVLPSGKTLHIGLPATVTSGWYLLQIYNKQNQLLDKAKIYLQK